MGLKRGQTQIEFSTRDLVYIAIFGALWGLVETSLGSYFHAVRIPFYGAILTAIGLLLALCGRSLIPRRGAVLMIGLITACLKLLDLGGIILSPLLAIVVESVLAEAVLWPFSRPGRVAFALAGAVATLWTVIHPFITQGLLAGSGLVTVYQRLLEGTARTLPFVANAVWLLLAGAILVPVLLGVVAGLAAHDLGKQLSLRLAR